MIRSFRSCFGLLAVATLSTSVASGQESQLPVSRTVGVIDVSLPVNQTTLMAIPLVEIVASGTVTAVSGTTYTLSSSPSVLPNVMTTPHAIKITSRVDQRGTAANAPAGASTNAYGLSAQITAQPTGQQVTAALATAPNVGDEFVVYQLETIGSIFGATNTSGLLGGGDAGSADNVYVENGGTLTGYFYSTAAGFGATPGWKLLSDGGTGADRSGVIIPANKGLLIIRKAGGSPASIRFTGDSVVGNEKPVVVAGFNLVNNPFTVATTLDASLLKDSVTGGGDAGSADVIYVENGGVLTGYFYNTSAGFGATVGWKLITEGGTGANQGGVVIQPGKSILFQEKAGTASFALMEPFAE
jgi:hypothetical protein